MRVVQKIECPYCKEMYYCVAHKLNNGEFDFGKINGGTDESIVKNCVKMTECNGKIYITAQCPKCKTRTDITIAEEK